MELFKVEQQDTQQIHGLIYIPEYISKSQEQELIKNIDEQQWLNDLKRRVQHYGYKYDYKARTITSDLKIGEIPNWLAEYTNKFNSNGYFSKIPDQVIINEYQPGQGISPHIDCIPCFDNTVASLSLLSPCIMEFINPSTNQKIPVLLERRSAVILKDDARYKWQHSIPARKTDKLDGFPQARGRRLSLTFRNMITI